MSHRLIVILAAGLALVAASAALAAPAKLTVTSHTQFAVRGASFHPREHVLVVVTTTHGARASKRVQAGGGGAFTVRFPSVQIASCEGYTVRATGDGGSQATVKVRPPECPQPLTP